MKIKNFKKKSLVTSFVLIFTGLVIALAGFGLVGFSLKPFAEPNGHRWFQTIYLENGYLTFGFQTGNFSIPKIGGEMSTLTLFSNVNWSEEVPETPEASKAPEAP